MKNIIVDTDILIDFLRGKKEAQDFLISSIEDAIIYCSAITVAEIFAGMKSSEKEKTTGLIDSLHIVEVNREIAEKAGEYKRNEKRQSLELDDCFIAATAFVKKAILATGNGKHYPMSDIQKEVVRLSMS